MVRVIQLLVRHTLWTCVYLSLFPPLANSEADNGLYTYSAGLATASPMEASSDNQFHQQTYYPGGMDPMDPASLFGLDFDTNRCKNNTSYIWCLPQDYNQEKHPFSCRLQTGEQISSLGLQLQVCD